MTYENAPAAQPAYETSNPFPHGFVGKQRSPIVVWILGVVTFGIYWLVWYYLVNEEIARSDSRIQVNPVLALLAQLVPIVNLVSIYNTGVRIKQLQGFNGVPETASGGFGILWTFILTIMPAYYQSELNKISR
ncbi:DUF4234 domain-containing protein [Jonesia quinghaiensis]|uniref:DUF4234 domain-containing protein n=1 Tax=Jonesia quinghaiensis TaxID=262806 RepID=UPI00041F52F5|nr:DUF4234 domain-containing protein [Jonesia quinghaiensis]